MWAFPYMQQFATVGGFFIHGDLRPAKGNGNQAAACWQRCTPSTALKPAPVPVQLSPQIYHLACPASPIHYK